MFPVGQYAEWRHDIGIGVSLDVDIQHPVMAAAVRYAYRGIVKVHPLARVDVPIGIRQIFLHQRHGVRAISVNDNQIDRAGVANELPGTD